MSSLTRPLIVLGPNRSGTSSLSAALRALGFYWGEEKDFPVANEFNEEGYWEHNDIVQVNRQFLVSLNIRFYQAGSIPEGWEGFPRTDSLLKELEGVLMRVFSGHKVWGWKDPTTSVLLPFHLKALDELGVDPHFIICVRNPLDVAASLARRDYMAEGPALGIWIRYTLAALRDTVGRSRTVMTFNDFMEDPCKALAPTIAAHGVFTPTEEAWRACADTIRHDLIHSRRPLEDLDVLPSIFRKTFELCQEAAADGKGLNAGMYDGRVAELWDEIVRWSSYLSDLNPPTSGASVFGQKAGQPKRSDTPYIPGRGWTTLKMNVDVDPNSWVTAALYHLPCAIWMRNPVWHVGDKQYSISLRPGRYGHIEPELGYQRLFVSHGPEQLAFQTPPVPGPYVFEIDLFLEMNLHLTNQIFATLVQQLDAARNHAAQLEARFRSMQGNMGGFTRKTP